MNELKPLASIHSYCFTISLFLGIVLVHTSFHVLKTGKETKQGGVVGRQVVFAVIQRDQEKGANRKLIKFNRGSEKPCTWGGTTADTRKHWGLTCSLQGC